ncbi:hypothetical protein O5559_28350, partial [Escherichia coli]|nr:hypothetical protein [Escherichia coli]
MSASLLPGLISWCGSRVMVSGTGHTGKILSIDT